MIPYTLHVALLLVGFFLLYKLLLEKETFFLLNRWMLLFGAIICFLLPLYQIPQEFASWQAVTTLGTEISSLPNTEIANSTPIEAIGDIRTKNTASPSEATKPNLFSNFDLWQSLWYIYLAGLFLFGINLLIQLGTLISKIIRLPSLKDEGYRIVELDKDEPPYSFLNFIFINPEKYEWETYNQIIEHEKIHIQQVHSLDMILAEILVVLQWFNPAAWQYRKLIENNLEFLTDSTMLGQGTAPSSYQLNLLKVSVPQYPIGLAMNYNQSFLKKRINMMNAKKSSVRSSWKYLILFPILGLSVIALNPVKATTQEKQISQTEHQTVKSEKEEKKATAKNETVKSSFDSTTDGARGMWYAERDGAEICIRFETMSKTSIWSCTRCFDVNEFTGLSAGSTATKLTRDAGEVNFNKVIGSEGDFGKYNFTINESFQNYLKQQQGYSNMEDELLLHLFMANINKAYFQYMAQQGYRNISKSQLKKLAIHGLTQDYLEEQLPALKANGFTDNSVDQLVKLKIHGVGRAYIDDMGSVGFDDLDMDDLLKGSIHGVEADYVKEIRSLGYRNLLFQDFVKFKIHGVNRDLVESLASIGFKNLSAHDIKSAAIHGVNKSYINRIKKAGYDLENIDDLIAFKIHGVNQDLVESLASVGFNNLSAHEIKSAAIHGVSKSYINRIKKAGYNLEDIDDLIAFKIHGVSTEFIASLQRMGYTDIPADKIKSCAIHGVDTDFIEGFRDLGFRDISLQQAIKLRIHGVTPSVVKRARAKGMTDLTLEQYLKMKIHGTL